MPSFPFEQAPTFAQYLEEAARLGCKYQCGHDSEKLQRLTRIVSPDESRWVVEVGTMEDDRLLPSAVLRLDRRLGITTSFYSEMVRDEI